MALERKRNQNQFERPGLGLVFLGLQSVGNPSVAPVHYDSTDINELWKAINELKVEVERLSRPWIVRILASLFGTLRRFFHV